AHSIGRAFHIVTGVGYALIPAALYILGRQLFDSRAQALLAAIAWSFFPSPAYAMETWRTIAKPYHYAPWGFVALIGYDEAAHAFAFPFVLLSLAAAWRNRRVTAAILAGVVFLINWPGLIGLLVILAALAIATRRWIEVIGIGGTAYGLSAFWMTPGYFVTSSLLNRIVLRHTLTSQPFSATTYLIFAIAIALLAIAFWRRWFLLAWVALTGIVVVSFTVAGNYLLPSPHRYMLEFNAGCVLLLAALFRRFQIPAIVIGLALSWSFLTHAWPIQPKPQDPTTGVAYRIAQWLNDHAGHSRVFVSGELDSTLPLWSDVPQVGGSGQAVSNFLIWAAERQIAFGCGIGAEPIAELWLRALNVRYFVVHEANSREYFHWFAEPEKFRGQMEVAFDDGEGNVIYRMPDGPESVKVDPPAFEPIRSTKDAAFLEAYVAWAAGKLNGTGTLVKSSYDAGWNGKPDPIGFLLTNDPNQHYRASWEVWLGRVISLVTILLLLARVPLKWIAVIAVVPAITAYAILLPRTSPVEEEAFIRLQPPLINPGGIVNAGNGLYTVYALNIGGHPKVWLGDHEAEVISHGPQNVTFRAGNASPDTPVSIESNGCRGNEFTLGWRP
ncbi:MAG TPA: hypothetical protein VEF06_08400, partial [Bryobacteraceae bacterium]|nr:hypothetical protein [Bryobacteraceae bacterium]